MLGVFVLPQYILHDVAAFMLTKEHCFPMPSEVQIWQTCNGGTWDFLTVGLELLLLLLLL
jgi:hypothetical protein